MRLPVFGSKKDKGPIVSDPVADIAPEGSVEKLDKYTCLGIKKNSARLFQTVEVEIVGSRVVSVILGNNDSRAMCLAKIEKRLVDITE